MGGWVGTCAGSALGRELKAVWVNSSINGLPLCGTEEKAQGAPAFWPAARAPVPFSTGSCPGQKHFLLLALNRARR